MSRRAVDPASDRTAATRARLLDAAEQAFLERPFDEVSVRTINATAGFNPAATHYHFGSKEGLVVALLEDRLASRAASSQDRLSQLEAQEHVDLEEILALAVDDLLTLANGTPVQQLWVHLLATVLLRGSEVPFVSGAFSLDRWTAVVARAVPDVPLPVLRARWGLAVTLQLEVIGRPLGRVPHELVEVDREQLIAFLAGGLRASA